MAESPPKTTYYTPQSEMIYCKDCNAPFATSSGLRYHTKAMHGDPKKKVPLEPKEEINFKVKIPATNVTTVDRKDLKTYAPASKTKVPANPKPLKADDIAAELVSSVDDIPEGIVYECELCSRQEDVLLEMEIHLWTYHSEHLTTPSCPKRFISCRCSSCDLKLPFRVKSHTCVFKPPAPDVAKGAASSRRSCGACFREVGGPRAMTQHVLAHHIKHMEVLYFTNQNEFISWKQRMESTTCCNYKNTGQQGATTFGLCDSQPAGLLCPSTVAAETLDGGLKVNFYKHHFGHEHKPYNVENKFKKNHLTDFLKTSNLIDSDMYIQFKNLMDNIVLEAAKLDRNGLTKIYGRAMQLALSLTSDDERNDEQLQNDEQPQNDEEAHVDGHDDVSEELIVPEVLDTPVKRPIDSVIGQKVLPDSEKRSSVRLKNKVHITEPTKPILKEDATPAKRLKRSVTIANDVPTKKSVPSKAIVPSEASMPRIVSVKSEVSSPSFNDSYKNFVEENLVKDKAKSRPVLKTTPTPKNAPTLKNAPTPKNAPPSKNAPTPKNAPTSKNASTPKITPILKKVPTPKSMPPAKKVSPKSVSPKTVSPKKLRTKLGRYKPRSSSAEPAKVDLSKIKIEGYEVKEQENDCNILVLKI